MVCSPTSLLKSKAAARAAKEAEGESFVAAAVDQWRALRDDRFGVAAGGGHASAAPSASSSAPGLGQDDDSVDDPKAGSAGRQGAATRRGSLALPGLTIGAHSTVAFDPLEGLADEALGTDALALKTHSLAEGPAATKEAQRAARAGLGSFGPHGAVGAGQLELKSAHFEATTAAWEATGPRFSGQASASAAAAAAAAGRRAAAVPGVRMSPQPSPPARFLHADLRDHKGVGALASPLKRASRS